MVQPQRPESAAAQASRYLGIGLTWSLSTGLFLYLGTVADRYLGTEPWLTLIGAFVGAAAGFWYMYYHLVIEPERKRKEREGGGGA
jgi:F0F1-type ATP synthase assembly protein I